MQPCPAPEHVHTPRLQTWPVAHLVPHAPQLDASLCRSLQVPPQLVCPDAQQVPLEQTWPDEHTLPQLPQLVVVVNVTQTLEQQLCPAAQQTPAQGVVPVAQDKQSVPAALHPLVQVVVAGVGHCPFALQSAAAVLTPPEQDCPAPHEVPLILLVVTVHIELPVAHDVVPFWQALGWQGASWLHIAQVPARQNRFIPQLVPSDAAVLLSIQTDAPVAHAMVPLWHGAEAGVHESPALHGTQVPVPLQTPPVQVLPTDLLVVAVHTDCPVPHEVTPFWHAFDGGVHASPAVHAEQVPLRHTRLLPQLAPFDIAFPLSLHTGTPVVQEKVPV